MVGSFWARVTGVQLYGAHRYFGVSRYHWCVRAHVSLCLLRKSVCVCVCVCWWAMDELGPLKWRIGMSKLNKATSCTVISTAFPLNLWTEPKTSTAALPLLRGFLQPLVLLFLFLLSPTCVCLSVLLTPIPVVPVACATIVMYDTLAQGHANGRVVQLL